MLIQPSLGAGAFRLSRRAAPAVPLAPGGLAYGVGMGPRVSPPPWAPAPKDGVPQAPPEADASGGLVSFQIGRDPSGTPGHLPRQTSRPLSTGRLRALPRFHLRPIKQVVSLRPPGSAEALREEVSGGDSRLDAFSGSPFWTRLPGGAAGATTGTLEVRPSRSSRTRDSFPQISCAPDRKGPNCLTTF